MTANNLSKQHNLKYRSYSNLISVLKIIQSIALLGSIITGLVVASIHPAIGIIALVACGLSVYVSTQSFIAIIDLLSQIERNTRVVHLLKEIEYNTRYHESGSYDYYE